VTRTTRTQNIPEVLMLTHAHVHWPRTLEARLGGAAPASLWAIGNPDLLGERKVGLFCSVRCPNDAILAAHNAAREFCENGTTVISGFHSPVEKECLRILLQGKQPIIISLARAFGNYRLLGEWREALEAGRLLLLSPFEKRPRRADTRVARQRNEFVAALADEVLIIHATPGGQIERISELVDRWRIPKRKLG